MCVLILYCDNFPSCMWPACSYISWACADSPHSPVNREWSNIWGEGVQPKQPHILLRKCYWLHWGKQARVPKQKHNCACGIRIGWNCTKGPRLSDRSTCFVCKQLRVQSLTSATATTKSLWQQMSAQARDPGELLPVREDNTGLEGPTIGHNTRQLHINWRLLVWGNPKNEEAENDLRQDDVMSSEVSTLAEGDMPKWSEWTSISKSKSLTKGIISLWVTKC